MDMVTQLRLKYRWLLPLVCVFYVAAHFVLSRISAPKLYRTYNIPDQFLYLPVDPYFVADGAHPVVFSIHRGLAALFYPIWKLDLYFGGPQPMRFPPIDTIEEPIREYEYQKSTNPLKPTPLARHS